VTDILKGLAGGGWTFLVSWVFPSAIAISVFALLIYPELTNLAVFKDIQRLGGAEQALVIAFASLALGLLLSATSTALFRVLEGYLLMPAPVRAWKVGRQLERKRALQRELGKLDDKKPEAGSAADSVSGSPDTPVDQPPRDTVHENKLRERLHRFPADDRQVAPTHLANSIRAFETYAYNRFQFDSQVLWAELMAVVPKSLKDEYEQSRAPVNFFVSLLYLSAILGVVSLLTAWRGPGQRFALATVGVICLLLVPACYWFAVPSTRYWHATVQALVNIGRRDVAAKFGLRVPLKLEQEREMWQQVSWFVYEDFDPAYLHDLDGYREDPDRPSAAPAHDGGDQAGSPGQKAGSGSADTADDGEDGEGEDDQDG
jgi:hypothetical protein